MFNKLIDGGLLVLDGSDGSFSYRKRGSYKEFWKHRQYGFPKGRDPVELVDTMYSFQDKSQRLFTCVGYIGRGTFVWRVEKCTSFLNLPLNLKSFIKKDNAVIGNDEWLDELIAWADEKKISEEKFPRDKELILSLKTLDLSKNQLNTLPESIGNLTNVTTLHLSMNSFSTLPESIRNLRHLTCLMLYDNKLTTLPEWIGDFKHLATLDLAMNLLTTLPELVGNFKHLTWLSLSKNQLSTLPDSIGNLINLTNLSKNQLSTLPKSIEKLKNLTNLNLSGNQFGTLPESILNLNNLRELHLSDNPLSVTLTEKQ